MDKEIAEKKLYKLVKKDLEYGKSIPEILNKYKYPFTFEIIEKILKERLSSYSKIYSLIENGITGYDLLLFFQKSGEVGGALRYQLEKIGRDKVKDNYEPIEGVYRYGFPHDLYYMLKSGKKEIEKQLDFLLYMKEKEDQKNK